MSFYTPGRVYENLIKMMEYRNVALAEPALTTDIVSQKLNHFEYVIIHGKRPSTDMRGEAAVYVILLSPTSKYAAKSAEFKKLLKVLPKTKIEVVFISEEPLTIHIKKVLVQIRLEMLIAIEDYPYSIFMIEAPKHESVPIHTIATDAEVAEFCIEHFTTRERFPKIIQSDVQAVWLGLKPGMVVRVDRISETAGTAIAYRYCVR